MKKTFLSALCFIILAFSTPSLIAMKMSLDEGKPLIPENFYNYAVVIATIAFIVYAVDSAKQNRKKHGHVFPPLV